MVQVLFQVIIYIVIVIVVVGIISISLALILLTLDKKGVIDKIAKLLKRKDKNEIK